MPKLHLYLLGPPNVEIDDRPVAIQRRKVWALLAYLAVTDEIQRRDSLATLFWPNASQSKARAALTRHLSELRQAIGQERLTADRETVGLTGDLWLDVQQFQQLVAECQQDSPDCLNLLTEAVNLYRDDFLTGFTLPDCPDFDEWQFFQTEELRQTLATVLERLIQSHSQQNDHAAALPYARRQVALDPLHEPAHRTLMQLYALTGQQAAALRQYQLCLDTLADELGVAPSSETSTLYDQILAGTEGWKGEGEIRFAAQDAALPLVGIQGTEQQERLAQLIASAEAPGFITEPTGAPEAPPELFVGREEELARLHHALDAMLTGRGGIHFVSGEAGAGKTALVTEFTRRALDTYPELVAAAGVCNDFTGAGDPYLPFRDILHMLTGEAEAPWRAGALTREQGMRLWHLLPLTTQALLNLGPELLDALVRLPPLIQRTAAYAAQDAGTQEMLSALVTRQEKQLENPAGNQDRLFATYAAVLETISAQHPLLLFLDDLHWADRSSIALLSYLGHRLAENRLLIVGSYRPEDVAQGRDGQTHPLSGALNELKRLFGDIRIHLAAAQQEDGRAFVDALLDAEPNRLGSDFRDALAAHTGGNPLFTVEVLRNLQEQGDLERDAAGRWAAGQEIDWHRLPPRVEGVIERRFGRLDPELQEMLTVASVEGERFTAEVLASSVHQEPRQVVSRLSGELDKRHRLVKALGIRRLGALRLSRYRFRHHLVQQYLLHRLDEVERAFLHEAVAEALESLYQDQTGEIALQLAGHYQDAGRPEKAIPYLVQAGQSAARAYANAEAMDHFQLALALLGDWPVAEPFTTWRLEAWQGLGRLHFVLGQLDEAELFLRRAMDLGGETGLPPRQMVRLYYWLAEVLTWQGRRQEKIPLAESGLALLGQDTETVEAALMLGHLAVAYLYGLAKYHEFRQLINRLARIVSHLPYTRELRPCYFYIINANTFEKDLASAESWRRRLVQNGREFGDLHALAEAQYWTGLHQYLRGDLLGAVETGKRVQELAVTAASSQQSAFAMLLTLQAQLGLGEIHQVQKVASDLLDLNMFPEFSFAFTVVGSLSLGQQQHAADTSNLFLENFHRLWANLKAHANAWLGWVYLALENPGKAMENFTQALARRDYLEHSDAIMWPVFQTRFATSLGGLERAYQDSESFHAFCRRYREEYPQALDDPFVQWYLEAAAVGEFANCLIDDEFNARGRAAAPLSPAWTWHDPFGDCAVLVKGGVVIRAANGRGLFFLNLSAPRLLREVSGDFAAQTVCATVSETKPAMGGLLLWLDQENYLRLEWGGNGQGEITFTGCLNNKDVEFGRGRLEGEPIHLRLERQGRQVLAFCSADGQSWFSVGYAAFPVADPLQIGLFAIGDIDRTIYPGAFQDGTAVCFERFWLWQ